MKKQIDRLAGKGKVLLGDRVLGPVQYTMIVYQEFIQASSFGGTEQVPGIKSISGDLRVLDGPKDLELASEWTLQLSDGRHCQCVATQSSLATGVHQFSVSGGIG